MKTRQSLLVPAPPVPNSSEGISLTGKILGKERAKIRGTLDVANGLENQPSYSVEAARFEWTNSSWPKIGTMMAIIRQ